MARTLRLTPWTPGRIALFLLLTFALSWGFELTISLTVGHAVFLDLGLSPWWVAAFLHGLVNSLYAFGLTYLVRPDDKIWSFGLGIYGLLCLAGVVLVLLRDPVWHKEEVLSGMGVSRWQG